MDINFGNAKPRKPVTEFEEGTYTLEIATWECKPPKDGDPDRGRNIQIKFNILDLEGAPPMWHNVWVEFADPWSAKLFFEALMDRELGEDDSIPDISDPDYWVGEKINCALMHETYQTKAKKDAVKWAPTGPDAWTPAA